MQYINDSIVIVIKYYIFQITFKEYRSLKRELQENSKSQWSKKYNEVLLNIQRVKMKRKADGDMNRMKKRMKIKQKKRKEFQIEVRKQQELGNYYMVMITPNINLFITN